MSVGYRVNSQRAIQFRQCATRHLKDYLVKGYTINQKRLDELQQTVQLISDGAAADELHIAEAKGL
ncbi:RhuM family protein [Arachidicoccus sp.]|uniref:RhuM family protein n=1 Tax=Arachidicoccus sp. TaxID=1872624 RepID=UPI003D22C671